MGDAVVQHGQVCFCSSPSSTEGFRFNTIYVGRDGDDACEGRQLGFATGDCEYVLSRGLKVAA